ncbi:MAG: hypothetical protein K2Y42_06315 [Hyphomicrobium sp.]|uniref:hypothetical protein n=1 Tax=Hyphomicrobium sp. TaxID=82 RepID=UPI0025BDEEDA|nr:hypothetical protein [Hyphomicrobium sp.]MBX9862351.1 hypothetical protein [Hyphomicrobium sp.]
MREALKGKAYLATALSQGRVSVEHTFITELAATLSLAADELTRPLIEQETNEWSFYRTSAANREAVWNKAMALARSNKMTLRDTADAIGFDFADLSNAVSGKRPRVLEWHHAERLGARASPPADPRDLLPEAPGR